MATIMNIEDSVEGEGSGGEIEVAGAAEEVEGAEEIGAAGETGGGEEIGAAEAETEEVAEVAEEHGMVKEPPTMRPTLRSRRAGVKRTSIQQINPVKNKAQNHTQLQAQTHHSSGVAQVPTPWE
jgi:hypothetical protein